MITKFAKCKQKRWFSVSSSLLPAHLNENHNDFFSMSLRSTDFYAVSIANEQNSRKKNLVAMGMERNIKHAYSIEGKRRKQRTHPIILCTIKVRDFSYVHLALVFSKLCSGFGLMAHRHYYHHGHVMKLTQIYMCQLFLLGLYPSSSYLLCTLLRCCMNGV